DVVRNPTLGSTPYLARLMVRQIIPLSSETTDAQRGPVGIATKLPARRLELRVGKMGTVDFFDLNSVGSDSHLQFLNWTVDNNGAYDYAADTRGYTWGVIAEYQDRRWGLRFGEMLMPKVANGLKLDWNRGARAEKISKSSGDTDYCLSARESCVCSPTSITPIWAATAMRPTRSWRARSPSPTLRRIAVRGVLNTASESISSRS